MLAVIKMELSGKTVYGPAGPYTVLPDNSILTGFPSSHELKSYVASKSCLKLAARAVLSADACLLVLIRPLIGMYYSTIRYVTI